MEPKATSGRGEAIYPAGSAIGFDDSIASRRIRFFSFESATSSGVCPFIIFYSSIGVNGIMYFSLPTLVSFEIYSMKRFISSTLLG